MLQNLTHCTLSLDLGDHYNLFAPSTKPSSGKFSLASLVSQQWLRLVIYWWWQFSFGK